MMKKIFANPEIEVTLLACQDVVYTSGDADILNPGNDIEDNKGDLE